MASGPVRKIAVSARVISPAIPDSPELHKQLEEDLTRLGCVGLLHRPWNLKSEEMIQELLHGVPNQYELTLRGRPVAWTEDIWADVYQFRKSGNGLASRTDRFVAGKFTGTANPKDGFAISECKDERHRRILEFLIPILYPEKPTRVTITVANTIFGAMENRVVHWGRS